MNVDVPDKLMAKLRKAYDRTYKKEAKSVSDRGVILAILADSLHPIDETHFTLKT